MNFLKNTLLVVASTLVTLMVLEALLQSFFDPSRLYSNMHGVPALGQWYQEVKFWSRHRESRDFAANHDPKLGWDFEIGKDRIRGSRVVALTPDSDEFRIVAIGDSFTYGLDVEPEENYTALLNDIAGVEALNMGVPGYGIDQAYLKFIEHGLKYQPDLVLFGIYVSDYERSSLGFTSYAKPRFLSRGSEAILVGQPVPLPQQEFERIDRTLADRIYVLEVASNFWRKMTNGDSERKKFFNETDNIVRHILNSLQENLTDTQTLMVIHIPSAEAFIESNDFRHEMSRRLLDVYQELGVHYVDLTTEFITDREGRAVFEQHYVHFEDGSVGHLSRTGHARVAQLVLEALDERGIKLEQGNVGIQ